MPQQPYVYQTKIELSRCSGRRRHRARGSRRGCGRRRQRRRRRGRGAAVRRAAVRAAARPVYIPPEALEVFLETFEGPLDLLLYLIRRQNFNILDIPLADVTRQYLAYVEQIRTRNLELATEYLPNSTIELVLTNRVQDLLRREADIAHVCRVHLISPRKEGGTHCSRRRFREHSSKASR